MGALETMDKITAYFERVRLSTVDIDPETLEIPLTRGLTDSIVQDARNVISAGEIGDGRLSEPEAWMLCMIVGAALERDGLMPEILAGAVDTIATGERV